MIELFVKLLAVHDALTKALFPHAFGGAIALAYCTEEPRGTRDLDLNVFVPSERADEVLAVLPEGVVVTGADVETVKRDGQTRLWWGKVPVDIFLNNHPFHDEVAHGVRWVELGDRMIPVLDCAALIVFKALFNRTKDWSDIEAIASATPEDIQTANSLLTEMLGEDDPTLSRLTNLVRIA